jgi:hypothetical protein
MAGCTGAGGMLVSVGGDSGAFACCLVFANLVLLDTKAKKKNIMFFLPFANLVLLDTGGPVTFGHGYAALLAFAGRLLSDFDMFRAALDFLEIDASAPSIHQIPFRDNWRVHSGEGTRKQQTCTVFLCAVGPR